MTANLGISAGQPTMDVLNQRMERHEMKIAWMLRSLLER